MAIAANKMDLEPAKANLEKLKAAFPQTRVFPCSADVELALLRATEKGFVQYDGKSVVAGETANANPAIANAVARLSSFVEHNNGTGVQALLDSVAFELLDCIIAYPVEDERRYCDHYGNALPDAILLPNGSTALDLAGRIHTDLASGFLHAVNCRTKMRIGKEEKLKNGDVIKIVSAAK